jgi:transposase-like protein
MKGKRRRHDPEFKARVALEAIKDIKTIQEIAKDFDIQPVQVSEWKKTMAITLLAFSVQGRQSRSRAIRTRALPRKNRPASH